MFELNVLARGTGWFVARLPDGRLDLTLSDPRYFQATPWRVTVSLPHELPAEWSKQRKAINSGEAPAAVLDEPSQERAPSSEKPNQWVRDSFNNWTGRYEGAELGWAPISKCWVLGFRVPGGPTREISLPRASWRDENYAPLAAATEILALFYGEHDVDCHPITPVESP